MLKMTAFWGQRSSRMVGWSESFWRDGDSVTAEAENASNQLLARLFQVKGKETIGLGHRISVWDATGRPTRVSKLFAPTIVPGDNPNVSTIRESDYPTVAYLLQGTGGVPTRSTRQWIRGIWDDAIQQGGGIAPATGNMQRSDLLNHLTAGAWGIRSRLQGGNPKVNLINYDAVTGRFLTVTDHGFSAGDRVTLTRIRTSPQLAKSFNGAYTVGTVPNVKEFTLVGAYIPADVSLIISRTSTAQRLQYGILTAKWEILRATSRQVGRPFGSPSGKSKTRI